MNPLQPTPISESAFRHIQTLFAHESGIRLAGSKQDLVVSRLQKRVQQLGLADFDSYCELISEADAAQERTFLVDSLTTHETYFFREPTHFKHLANTVLPSLRGKSVRVWCAAASTGEEAYSLAMTLATAKDIPQWDVLGTDISESSLQTAQRGLFRMDRLQHMPPAALKQYCLRGTNEFEGAILIARSLRDRVQFCRHNLLESPLQLGKFDVIFLRNVLIYFEPDMRRKIVSLALESLKPGGWLYTGHADSLLGLKLPLDTVMPSVYRKPQPNAFNTANAKNPTQAAKKPGSSLAINAREAHDYASEF